MIIAVHVGMSGDGDDVVDRLIADDDKHLSKAGWALPTVVPPGDVETDIDEIFAGWYSWLDQERAQGAERVAFSDSRLTEGHFVQGEVRRFVDELRGRGSVRAVALTRRLDDHIVASYVQQLREGRTGPMRKREFTGSGKLYNYFPRLEKWIAAMGGDFELRVCPASGDPRDVAHAVSTSLGMPSPPIKSDDEALDLALSPDAAEAMRLINQRLEELDQPEERQFEIREAAFARLLQRSQGEAPLRMPPDGAEQLLHRYREASQTLAQSMSPADAELFLSLDLPPAVRVDESRSQSWAKETLTDLEVVGSTPSTKGSQKPPGIRLRQTAKRARAALAAGDDDAYQTNVSRLPKIFRQMPRYREQIPIADGETGSKIPKRIVQYWEPWPPPDELLPWMKSWSDIGMRDGTHRVVSFDEASESMAGAAGDRGMEAFRMAPHPAARADLFRYADLFLHGGWYVDAEHEALLPISDVHPWPVDHVFTLRTQEDRVPNGYIGACAGSALLRAVLDEACTNILERRGTRVIEMTGPEVFTRHVLAYLDEPDASYVVLPTSITFHVLQEVHNEAEYKAAGHWRDAELTD